MGKHLLIIAAFFLLSSGPVASLAEISRLEIADGLVSLRAENTPVDEVLASLAKAAGIGISGSTGDGSASFTFSGKPLDQVVAKILRDYEHSLIWEKVEEDGRPVIRLKEIRIFEEKKKKAWQQAQPPPSLDLAYHKGRPYVRGKMVAILKKAPDRPLLAFLAKLGVLAVSYQPATGHLQLTVTDDSDLEQLVEEMAELDAIKAIEPDYAYQLIPPAAITEVAKSQPELVHTQAATGAMVAVLDSGLHTSFSENPLLMGSYDATSASPDAEDYLGHGTQMSLVASGQIAPLWDAPLSEEQSPVVSIKIFDPNGYTSTSALATAINHAAASGSQVVSMSWGTEEKSKVMEETLALAKKNGMTLIAAAGNSPSGTPVYPAAFDSVIGVGALNPDGTVWVNSNYGDSVDVYAPGFANLPIGHQGDPGIYAGTSIATAYAAKTTASILAKTPEIDDASLLQELSQKLK